MLSADRLAAISGLVLLTVAGVWRVLSARRVVRSLHRALTDPDPATRCSAIAVAASQGLSRHAAALMALVRSEEDRDVIRAVAEAVARNRWEPADSPRLLELRLWADAFDDPDVDVEIDRPQETRKGPASARHRIVVTGAGGPAGVAVIRALRERGHDVVAVDADPLAAGAHLVERSSVIPTADDPRFVDVLLDVANSHDAEAIVPTITEEMIALAWREDEVRSVASVWLPSIESLEACRDKWRFAEVMARGGIRIPPTATEPDGSIPPPWVVKPRCSRGSRDVRYVETVADLESAVRRTSDPIIQRRVDGAEFTVDALVDRAGEVVGAVPRWRLETKAGISTKGRTFSNEGVICGSVAVLSALGLHGAANVQGFVEPDGSVTFLEVNPRFSGGLPLSLAAGADLVGEFVRGLFDLPVRSDHLGFRTGTTMIRHFEEMYI